MHEGYRCLEIICQDIKPDVAVGSQLVLYYSPGVLSCLNDQFLQIFLHTLTATPVDTLYYLKNVEFILGLLTVPGLFQCRGIASTSCFYIHVNLMNWQPEEVILSYNALLL